MRVVLPENLIKLSEFCPSLYAVGGCVRNFLISGITSDDIDIAAPFSAEEIKAAAEKCGFKIVAEYKRTGTAVVFDGQRKYEYTRFRTDIYGKGGRHTPDDAEFTGDITLDALRRDFKCNAVYYDIKKDVIVDPLGGAEDIKNKVLDTVKDPKDVFCSDGLRLMRLARLAGELGFTPTEKVLHSAKEYAGNIRDIAPERIYEELKKILAADSKYPFSDKRGHYTGVKILEKTGVLDILFPELAAERSFYAFLYADIGIRLAALLYCVIRSYCLSHGDTDKVYAEKSERLARNILNRLKADGRTAAKTAFLIKNHNFDSDNTASESPVRLFIVENRENLAPLLKLKQAVYFAENGENALCPTVEKWTAIYEKMRNDGTPFSLKELKISPVELSDAGYEKRQIGEELKRLFEYAVVHPEANDNAKLRSKVNKDIKSGVLGT